ncbi:hypothetical protein DFJ73DRAFT_816471 [Zopfochytrium polystomum]|nr:hypothetical protein DFJ73DRAFT_816471 [Zopfochytrium polystomum]
MDQLIASLPGVRGSAATNPFFFSNPMVRRERRLKEAKSNADRCNRDLTRDRLELERKEKALMTMVKEHAKKGDIPKARIVARQIAHYRSAADRNFESAAMIQTRAQLMASNHKINRAEIEAIKGARYANLEDTLETAASRERKYAQRMSMFEEMERIMNEGMDEVYGDAEDARKKTDYFEIEAEAVLRQALNPKQWKGRYYADPQRPTAVARSATLHLRLFEPTKRIVSSSSSAFSLSPLPSVPDGVDASPERPQLTPATAKGASVEVPTLDLSVDMLKRLIAKDPYILSQMHLNLNARSTYDAILGVSRPFKLGKIEHRPDGESTFVPYDFASSLKSCGIRNGSEIVIMRTDDDE